VLPEAEMGTIPGFGCMVTKPWREAYFKGHLPLMIEIARTNMQRYWDKVTDVQSKASLLLMLGHSLINTFEREAMQEGTKCNLEVLELIRSMGERSTTDIVFGVWPENCVICWQTFLGLLDPSERNGEMEWMLGMVNLTRRMINSVLKRGPGSPGLLRFLSEAHYKTAELQAIFHLSSCFDLLSVNDAERWLAIFEKRVEEIETVVEREGWDLKPVRKTKADLIQEKCRLCDRQGKAELAQELIREAMEKEKDPDLSLSLIDLHAELSLKTGRIEEAFESMEKYFSATRSNKAVSVKQLRYFLQFFPKESQSLFGELVLKYPHVLWATNSAGLVKLSEEENKALRSQLDVKKGLYCVNCSKELKKVYRCSRCDIATYCGTTCQKEAWKDHKKICKKRE
jgi:tetratricopeptide (TPR) repeat protein